MKTTFFKLFAITTLITFVSCKKEATLEYKYADQPKVLACDFPKSDLYKEAVFAFEEDIKNLYDSKGKSISKSYLSFLTNALNGRMKVEDMASKHSYDIAQLLKNDPDIWNKSSKNVTLNYNAPFMDCIANNIKMSDIKITFNALLSTNSMRPNLILTPLRGIGRQVSADGSLKTFVAFEYYYAKLMNMDPALLKKPAPAPAEANNNNVNFNNVPKKDTDIKRAEPNTKRDSHAGHNH
jgi:hypothetical protein